MSRFFSRKTEEQRVFKGISLTIKVLVLTLLISAIVWVFLDDMQSKALRSFFVAELAKQLEIQAKENRLFFDHHVQSHHHAAQLILSQQRFQEYVSGEAWLNNEAIIHHQRLPLWLPSSSVMRTFFNARYALLIDSEGQVQEVYHYFPENPPPSLLTPGELLQKFDHNQSYLTTVDGFPYVLATQSFENTAGQVVATLLLASPVDNEFLIAAMGTIRSKQLVSLLEEKRVIASSNPDLLHTGRAMDSLEKEYLITNISFLDCSTPEVTFRLVSYVPINKAHHLVNQVVSKEQAQRALLALVLVLSYVLLTLWMTWRIKRISQHIVAFSKDSLGIEPRQTGDEISIMQRVTLEMSNTMRRVMGDIQHTVSAAKQGNLTHRVDTRHLNGFMKELGESTNQLIVTTSEVIVDLTRVMSALAQGDLNQRTKDDYEGIYAEVSTFARITIANIKNIVLEIQTVVDNASHGKWDRLITLSNKQGFSKDLSHAVNTLIEIQKNFSNDIFIFLENLKNGDLTQPIQSEYEGEFDKIKQNANRTIETLISMLFQIKQIADAINHAATDLEMGNNSLSRRTEAQAVFLEETVTSMEEMTTTVEQNAENAQTAHQLALSAAEVAGDGGMIVEEAVDTMQQVRDFSQQMLGIINIIKKNAFQTNMLALNAAVEAAHAGEHGRGFAVIAKEVRNLAQRSTEEAKEINTLIEDSVSNIEIGTILVEQAKDSMHEIITSFQRVTDITSNISKANLEQSKGIKQINIAIAQMDKMTQENTALVEQVAANATGLAEQAAKLTEAFGQFKGHW